MRVVTERDMEALAGAETQAFAGPIPTQVVASEEYLPPPQSAQQKQVEARLAALGDRLSARLGMSRRRFFQTASGMAASFLVMNEVYGALFDTSQAEAATPDLAQARADALKGQFIFDGHTHFLRDDTALGQQMAGLREAIRSLGWNPALKGRQQTPDDLKFPNYIKEIFLDSDTKVALLSNAPSEVPKDWFIPQAGAFEARDQINAFAGSRRMLAHFTITPGMDGWLDDIDKGIGLYRPDSWKGYTVGDNTHKELAHHAYRLDDEKLMYPAYEKFAKAGIRNVCIHKGLFGAATEKRFPHLLTNANVDDVGQAARDWPQLNFVIYHSGYRWVDQDSTPEEALAEIETSGRCSWVSDLADIPARYGVNNVYADLGQVVAFTAVAQPRVYAFIMGTLIKGLGADHVVWGTDALWTGSPQWQIEGFRRLEIPEDMRKAHGFAPLGAADGPVKTAIFGGNSARLYNVDRSARQAATDRISDMKHRYEALGPNPSNLRYGYVPRTAAPGTDA